MKRVQEGMIQQSRSSASNSGILIVCISMSLWLLVDTFIAVMPSTEIDQSHNFDRSPLIKDARPGADYVHLWWLIQISDIHISSYRNFHIPENLKLFLTEVVPTVKPLAVVATGDLTDAKQANVWHSQQEMSEWEKYKQLLDDYLHSSVGRRVVNGKKHEDSSVVAKIDEEVTWIDMRGNHDKFDVASNLNDHFSKYSRYAHEWKKSNRHVTHKFTVNGTKYAIVATDATPTPGFRRPYNFFGVLSEETLSEFRATDEALLNEGVQTAIWSGHYPASTIFVGGSVSSEKRLFDGNVIRHGAVYLCGHLHTIYDAETALYARHAPLGQLELELADFQRSAKFRILAVDHGLVSFTDVPLRQWPIVLVTNPKEALYAMPNHEPLDKILSSTHVRVLAFSTAEILFVQVVVDGKILGNATRNSVSSSFYTLPWSSSDLEDRDFHKLEVTVVDAQKRSATQLVVFFVKPEVVSQLPFNIGGPFASLILLSNIPKIIRNGFLISTLFCVILLMTARFHPRYIRFVCPNFISRGLIAFSNLPRFLFVAFIFAVVYPVFGPWFLGEVLTNHHALVFAHGVLLLDDGRFIPDAVAAFNGLINALTFYLPLLLYFSWLMSSPQGSRIKPIRVAQRLVFQSLIAWQLWVATYDAQAYGWIAFVLNPMRTWISLLIIYIDMQARKSFCRKL